MAKAQPVPSPRERAAILDKAADTIESLLKMVAGLEATVQDLQGQLRRAEDTHHAFAEATKLKLLSRDRVEEAACCIVDNCLTRNEACEYLLNFIEEGHIYE